MSPIHPDRTGDDVLDGGDGDDTLDGYYGNDTLTGGLGADTYHFTRYAGNVLIHADAQDTLSFGDYLNKSDLKARRLSAAAPNTIVLSFADDTVDSLTLDKGDQLNGLQLKFVDGSVMSWADVYSQTQLVTNQVLTGTVGNDTLTGDVGNDTLNGLGGNDVLSGGQGNDTYLFDQGYGADVIADNGAPVASASDADTLVFGAATKASDLLLSKTDAVNADGSQDLVIRSKSSTDVLTIQGQFAKDDQHAAGRIETFTFADGTSWRYDQLDAMSAQTRRGTDSADTITGLQGQDTLLGQGGNDVLTAASGGGGYLAGGLGNDTLSGGTGADRFGFARGDGQDLIHADGSDTIELGAGIARTDLTIGKLNASGAGRVVLGLGGTDSITLDNAGNWNGLMVKFADGSVLSGADIMAVATKPANLTLTGTAGKDTLAGGDGDDVLSGLAGNDSLSGGKGNDRLDGGLGNDTLSGGAGVDTLIGGKGNDTYLFNRGDGQDTIVDTDSTWFNADLLKVGDAKSNQLWLTRSGYNLDISIIGTTDKVTVQDWFKGSANQVEKITAGGDGKSLSAAKVNALVNAMASFTPSAMAGSTLPTNTPAAITKLIATSWA